MRLILFACILVEIHGCGDTFPRAVVTSRVRRSAQQQRTNCEEGDPIPPTRFVVLESVFKRLSPNFFSDLKPEGFVLNLENAISQLQIIQLWVKSRHNFALAAEKVNLLDCDRHESAAVNVLKVDSIVSLLLAVCFVSQCLSLRDQIVKRPVCCFFPRVSKNRSLSGPIRIYDYEVVVGRRKLFVVGVSCNNHLREQRDLRNRRNEREKLSMVF